MVGEGVKVVRSRNAGMVGLVVGVAAVDGGG